MGNKTELSDSSASMFVLTSLMRDPLLLESEQYLLTQEDFPQALQQVVFTAIFNIAKSGVEKITPQDIDLYLKGFPSQYDYYEQHKGYDWILNTYQAIEHSDLKQFDFYYDRLKKFSILRDLNNNGFNIDEFYDINKDFLDRDVQDAKLNALPLSEIVNRMREKLAIVEDRHVGKEEATSQLASDGLRELVKELKITPEMGSPFDGDILNYAVRGARLGKLYIYSAPSGHGKTRFLVGNACAMSLPHIENHKIIIRKGLQKALFVATEMTAQEIQTLILAYVSGINEAKIRLGTYTPDEEQTLSLAIDLIEKYAGNFIIETMPDPSRAAVRAKLTKYIVQSKVEYIFYDYIFSGPGLLNEFRDLEIREDVMLMMLSNTLKEIAMSYNVFIMSATQLNGGWEKQVVRNANIIRGSKAIVDKIDIGLIGVRVSDEELKEVSAITAIHPEDPLPNVVVDLYKNRSGQMTEVKLFRNFDFGTCRARDLFVTTSGYKIYDDHTGHKPIVKFAVDAYDKITDIKKESEEITDGI